MKTLNKTMFLLWKIGHRKGFRSDIDK